jgi:hypothetical protein
MADRLLQAMIDVVMHQCLLGLLDRLFDRVELLRDFQTATLRLYHLDDRPQMTLGTSQPLDDCRMARVGSRWFLWHSLYPPWGDIC